MTKSRAIRGQTTCRWLCGALGLLLPAAASAEEPIALPPVNIVAASPLLGAGIDRDKAPAATSVLTGADIARDGPANALRALDTQVAGVALDDSEGNGAQPNLVFRGFNASPLAGNAQGLAVYVNGVRFNQAFGDTVNWDLLPDVAIDRINVEGANPVFGLNALGGSVSIQLKNGFTWQGAEAEMFGGSFTTFGGSFQYGRRAGDTAIYVAGNGQRSTGWRQFDSTDMRRIYGDIGWRGDRGEAHFNVLLADNVMNGPGTTPVELLAVDRAAHFTAPDLTVNKYALLSLSANWDATEHLSLQGLLYYSNLSQYVPNGTPSVGQPCGNLLCDDNGNVLFNRSGQPIGDFLAGGPYSSFEATNANTNAFGAALQASHQADVFGLHNQLVAGLSFDGGITQYTASEAVGGINIDRVFVGPGVVVAQPDGGVAPVRVGITNAYYGLYVSDVLDVTDRLSLSLSARLNVAEIDLADSGDGSLNGKHNYVRINPGFGFSYKLRPDVTLYGGYSEANRAPTPVELSCASALSPCTLANFFVGDPSLKQVVAHSFELGLRGRGHATESIALDWNLDVFRSTTDDDILAVASDVPGLQFFQNVGRTRRQGIEAGLTLRHAKFRAWLNYAYTDATFLTLLTISSPLNPGANADGATQVMPGNHLPGVPQHRLKFGASYAVTDAWTVGFSGILSSGQYLFGDEANLTPRTNGYVVLNANSSYRLTDHIELLALLQNALNARYETFGTFSQTGAIPIAQAPGASVTRSLSPAPPLAFYAGARVRF